MLAALIVIVAFAVVSVIGIAYGLYAYFSA
jgi:hypothetical protein